MLICSMKPSQKDDFWPTVCSKTTMALCVAQPLRNNVLAKAKRGDGDRLNIVCILETWGKWWICWGCFGGKRTGTCHSCLSLTSGLPNGEPVIWPFMNTTWLIFNFNEIQLQMKRRDQLYGGCLCLFGFLLSQVRWLNVSQDHQNQGKRWISTYFIAFISCIRRGEAGKKEKESREEEKPFLFLFFFFPAQQALIDPWSVLKCQNNDFDSIVPAILIVHLDKLLKKWQTEF